MNTVNSSGFAMDGLKKTAATQNNSAFSNAINTSLSPTGSQAAENIAKTAEDLKADAIQLQKMSDLVMGGKLQFNVNKELNAVIVKIIDPRTDKVIKEIPSADIQKLKINIRKNIGLLFDEMV